MVAKALGIGIFERSNVELRIERLEDIVLGSLGNPLGEVIRSLVSRAPDNAVGATCRDPLSDVGGAVVAALNQEHLSSSFALSIISAA